MSIEILKDRWNKDKAFFTKKEIGELQDFVKEVLQSSSIFNLKKGIGSTPNKKRKYEFTIETSKVGRRADFVIFIQGETIVIPVEVEKHENISKGIEQVFQYQKDWNKKYAILTDGKEWRFYRSNKYKVFDIEDMFDNPKDFIAYWNEYIKPETYYTELFKTSGQQKLFEEKIDLNQPGNRLLFFEDVTQVISNFKGKMRAIGAFGNLFEQNKNEKTAVETSYAYLIQFILYKVLVDNGYRRFNDEYNKTLNKIEKALQDKDFYQIIINEIKNISEYISSYIYKPFAEEQKNINKKLIDNLKGNLSIDDIAPWLDIILFINRYNFAGLKNEVFGYIYENFLKDLYQEKNKGQYFTDSAVVNFMLQEIGYNENEIQKRVKSQEISIIDPSCGAGTFLYSAVDRIINTFDDGTEIQSKHIEDLIDKNIFGLDIEEFPLYLAEMNILMRLLPLIVNDSYENPIDNKLKIFKTKDSISEFLDTGINSKIEEKIDLFNHLERTALDYPSFMRDEKDLEEMLQTLQEKSGVRGRFDFVIGNPPYIGYNESCNQEIEFTKKIKNKNDTSITMGNVYGMNLNTVPNRRKPYSPKPNLYAFFIALGLALLKNKGKLCYIIPQTILTSGDLDVLRYHLSKFTTIEKIITFDGNMFIGRGLKQNKPIPTSSLIFVLNKQAFKRDHKVKIISYSNYSDRKGIDFDKYIKSRTKTINEIPQLILLENVVNWNFIKHDDSFIKLYNVYKENSHSIEEYRRYDLKNYDDIMLDGNINIRNKEIKDTQIENSFLIPKLNIGHYCITQFRYFDKNKRIQKAQGSQNHNRLIELSNKILWRYQNTNGFYFTDKENVLPNFGLYCIASNDKQETIFLLSLLQSKINSKLLKIFLKNENEKAFLLGLTSVKEFIRVPKITKENLDIKAEIIKQTNKLLSLEVYQLKDFVDFTTMKQKFISIKYKADNLILTDSNGQEIKQRIKSNAEMVKELIDTKFNQKLFNDQDISLHELKYLEAIDKKKQEKIKDYIDDLVFSLYFNIRIPNMGLSSADKIKHICMKNEFYSYNKL